MFYFAVYIIIVLIFYLLIPLIPRILDIINPLNESRPLAFVYQAEHRVDKEKYYYPILFHSCVASTITMGILFTIDTTYMVCVLHACSLFVAIRYQKNEIKIKSLSLSHTHTHTHARVRTHTTYLSQTCF